VSPHNNNYTSRHNRTEVQLFARKKNARNQKKE
jgi:hypothetical protein